MISLPNALTLSRMVLAPVLLAVFHIGTWGSDLAALAILLVAGLTDLLDGYLARRMGVPTAFGKIVDPLADSFIFLSLFGCFVYAGWMPVWVFALFLFREAFMHAFLRPYFLLRGVALAAKWAGKVKTTLQSIVGAGVLLAIAATRHMPARSGSVKAGLMTAACWALFLVALVSLASLRPYVAELWRLRDEEKALAQGENAKAEVGTAAGTRSS